MSRLIVVVEANTPNSYWCNIPRGKNNVSYFLFSLPRHMTPLTWGNYQNIWFVFAGLPAIALIAILTIPPVRKITSVDKNRPLT